MDKIEEQIKEILNRLSPFIEAHDGFVELGEIENNKVVIYCGGECTACKEKCIEDAITDKLPHMNVVFR